MSGGDVEVPIEIVWPSFDMDAFSAGAYARPYRRIRPHIPAKSTTDAVMLKKTENLLPRPADEAYPKVSPLTKKKKATKKRQRDVPAPKDEDEDNNDDLVADAAPASSRRTKRGKRTASKRVAIVESTDDNDDDDSDFTS